MRYLSVIFAALCITACQPPRKLSVSTNKTYTDTIKHYQRILIVGEGNLQARAFAENVSRELMKELKFRNIEAHYEFLGDHQKVDTAATYQKALTWEHDAVLRFIPRLTAEERLEGGFPTSEMSAEDAINYSIFAPPSTTRIINTFHLTLDGPNTVWTCRIKTEGFSGKGNIYKHVSTRIISEWKANHILAH
jgi:hypothetical protein